MAVRVLYGYSLHINILMVIHAYVRIEKANQVLTCRYMGFWVLTSRQTAADITFGCLAGSRTRWNQYPAALHSHSGAAGLHVVWNSPHHSIGGQAATL